ncbi:hypothetical protein TELCIR_12315 [Teladorsagia circumcincta]|uniref:Uncharacterized protein n=1 Tax=Teladorsagia circumcincta TaxID=45464 RepID=A0A2G9U738_TELCI|nr:hypothetical protein TELCIR_12315 [Teladorsagia circumcincta]
MPKTFDECSLNNDLAILELGKNVKEDMATPICTPHSSTVLSKNLKSAGNGAITPDDNAPIDGQQMVHVQIVKILDSNRIITTAVDGVGICSVYVHELAQSYPPSHLHDLIKCYDCVK